MVVKGERMIARLNGGALLLVLPMFLATAVCVVLLAEQNTPRDDQAVPGAAMIPVAGVDEEVIVARLGPDQDLSDLARTFAPEAWADRWMARLIEVNGWDAVPDLSPDQQFLVPDWRPSEPDVWGTRPPMDYPEASR